MMALGSFIFRLQTAPYQELQQQVGWRHPSNSRVGSRPARQFIGPDDETVTLSGVLLPELTGGLSTLRFLRAMGDAGQAWPLIGADGTIHGLFVIESINSTQSTFFVDGTARKIDFTLTLKRVDDAALISAPATKATSQATTGKTTQIGTDGKPVNWQIQPSTGSGSDGWTIIRGNTVKTP